MSVCRLRPLAVALMLTVLSVAGTPPNAGSAHGLDARPESQDSTAAGRDSWHALAQLPGDGGRSTPQPPGQQWGTNTAPAFPEPSRGHPRALVVALPHVPDLSAQGTARANSPASGRPTISGKTQAGHTLTADTSDIADPDGLENATLTYQWIVIRGATEVDIRGATEPEYTLTGDDIGSSIAVTVSFTDDKGNREHLRSNPTSEIESAWPYEVLHPPLQIVGFTWYWRYNGYCTALYNEFETLSVDFTIHNDPNYSGGLFLMVAHGFISSTTYYFGLQTALQPDGGRGPWAKGALFSRWGTRDLSNAASNPDQGWTYEAGSEGDVISVRRSYEWSAGDYRARLARDSSRESSADGDWYGLWITDLDTNVETWIGSLRFPLERGQAVIWSRTKTFVEIYGGAVRPIDVPAWHVSVSLPTGDGVEAGCGASVYAGGEDVTSEVRYDRDQQEVHFEAFGSTRRRSSEQDISFLSRAAPDRAGRVSMLSDRPRVGETFSGTLRDPNGFADARWQWSRRKATQTGAFSEISGATESSYRPMPGDVGMHLLATVSYTDGYGPGKRATAVSRDPVQALVGNRSPSFSHSRVSFRLDPAAGLGGIVGTVSATDADGDRLTYTHSGLDAAFFAIDAGTGQIRAAAGVPFDTDARSQYRFRVHADDGQGGADTIDVIITVATRPITPPIILPPIGIGGGGGGPSGPTPSDEDFEWSVDRDIEELDPGHGSPSGLWSDSTTLWVLENGDGADDAIYAYDLKTGERVEEHEFDLHDTNRAPRGIWSNSVTMWVSDSGQDRLFAYDLASGARDEDRELELPRDNRDPRGIWSDGETMWVLDGRADALFAYDLETGELLGEYELVSANSDPRGIWSDEVSVWVSDHGAKRLFAYQLPTPGGPAEEDAEAIALVRVRDEEFTKLSRASNNSPRGIWSDGEVIYVADESDDRVYTYNMPDAFDARLASLALSDVEIGEFAPGRAEYEGVVARGVTETTVEPEAVQPDATVLIEPTDVDADADGHQAAAGGGGLVAVTVTSADGSRTKVYHVALAAAGPSAHCLRGAIDAGFSLVVFEGGSLEDLEACARSRHVTAAYALDGGQYISYILGAPEFVNARFVELFPDGVPALTALIAKSDGPATADPADGSAAVGAAEPWPLCLRGAIVEGFSLALYQGGSVDELETCARELGVTALYALDGGEYVPHIIGAPNFVNRPFRELFADSVPAVTPLIAKSDG